MLYDDITDQIALADHPDAIEGHINDAWVKHTHGRLTIDEYKFLQADALARMGALQTQTRPKPWGAPSGSPAPSARRIVRPPKRPRQRSPDRQKSLERRWRLFNELPLAVRLLFRDQIGRGAVTAVIVQRIQERGRCDLSVPEIAALAGVSDRTVQQTTQQEVGLMLFIVSPRRRGYYNDPNVITLTGYGREVIMNTGEVGCGPRRSVSKEEAAVDKPRQEPTPPNGIRTALVAPALRQKGKEAATEGRMGLDQGGTGG